MLIDPTAGVGYAFGQKFPSADATTIVLTLPKALDAIQGGAYSMLSGADGDGTIEFDGTAVPAAGQNGFLRLIYNDTNGLSIRCGGSATLDGVSGIDIDVSDGGLNRSAAVLVGSGTSAGLVSTGGSGGGAGLISTGGADAAGIEGIGVGNGAGVSATSGVGTFGVGLIAGGVSGNAAAIFNSDDASSDTVTIDNLSGTALQVDGETSGYNVGAVRIANGGTTGPALSLSTDNNYPVLYLSQGTPAEHGPIRFATQYTPDPADGDTGEMMFSRDGGDKRLWFYDDDEGNFVKAASTTDPLTLKYWRTIDYNNPTLTVTGGAGNLITASVALSGTDKLEFTWGSSRSSALYPVQVQPHYYNPSITITGKNQWIVHDRSTTKLTLSCWDTNLNTAVDLTAVDWKIDVMSWGPAV